MDIDFRAIKALSSRTRIKILRTLLEEEATAERLKQSVNLASDQVVMHLETLQNAGLVDARAADDGFSQVYEPTEKARAIVSGQERKVRFSMGTSALAAVMGAVVVGYQFVGGGARRIQSQASESLKPGAPEGTTAPTPPPDSGGGLLQIDPVLAAGVVLFVVAVGVFLYGRAIRQLSADSSG